MSETAFSSRSSDHSEEGRENQSLRCDGPDVGHAALPLSLDASTPSTLDGSRGLTDVPKSLTYLNCLALVVGLQIGSGIFSAPAIVTSHVSSPVAGVLVWVLAGGLVWTGAASFIELGTTIPMNGGIQEYLRHCYGDIYGFLFAWIWIFVVKPCSMAMVSLIFSEYLYKTISPKTNIATWTLKGTAFGGVCIITGLNCMGTYLGAGTAKFFMGVKLVGLGSITVIGFASTLLRLNYRDTPEDLNRMGPGGNRTSAPDVFNQGTPLLFTDSKDLADALFAALFAYGGWESISFVVGEMKDASCNLPRVLNNAMAIVISLSVLANIAFYMVLSLEEMRSTNAVAIAFGVASLGPSGAIFYSCVVCLSCLGALNATVFSMGRLTQAAGTRRYLPPFFQAATALLDQNRSPSCGWLQSCRVLNLSADQNIPRNAMILNACLSAVYILLGSFRGLLSFKGMTEYIIYFTTVLGILILRYRSSSGILEGDPDRYRTSILNPVVFCSASALIVTRSAITHVIQVVIIFLLFGCGVVLYRSRPWHPLVRNVEAATSR